MHPEDSRTEYKIKVTDKLEKFAVGFLNAREGGVIYIGVDNKGNVVGVEDSDRIQRQIIDRIKNNIAPTIMGLFEVTTEYIEGTHVIKVIILSGPDKPYYIRSKGMSSEGCYIRIGSSTQPMPIDLIESMFADRIRPSLRNIPSPVLDLSFAQLKIFYEENGSILNENFAGNLDLLADDGRYNYFAYLLADKNNVSMKIAKYNGRDKSDLAENKEFGNCSLIKAAFNVLNRLDIENVPASVITSSVREETYPVDPISLREAAINAIVHNDYSRELYPVFEIFSDKIVITSSGGLPSDITEEEFFNGVSVPRNRELMRIFRDIQLVEHIGSGIPRILKKYRKEIFHFSTNFLRVVFKYPETVIKRSGSEYIVSDSRSRYYDDWPVIAGDRTAIENKHFRSILKYLETQEYISNSTAMRILGLKASQTRAVLNRMTKEGILEPRGQNRYRIYVLKSP